MKNSSCWSVHPAAIRWLHFQHWLKVFAIGPSPLASSAMTNACVTRSIPWPPHSFATTAVRKPSCDPFRMMSQSKVARGSEMRSRCSDIGRNSSCATLRAFSCHARCSSVSETSMPLPPQNKSRPVKPVCAPARRSIHFHASDCLHPLHRVAGQVRPYDGVPDELVDARVHHRDTRAAVDVQVEIGNPLYDVGRKIHQENVGRGLVHGGFVVVFRSDPHHERAQCLGQHVHL